MKQILSRDSLSHAGWGLVPFLVAGVLTILAGRFVLQSGVPPENDQIFVGYSLHDSLIPHFEMGASSALMAGLCNLIAPYDSVKSNARYPLL